MTALALISDLHANLEAVEAVLRRIESLGVKEIACLGDVVGYGADPLPVTRLVMQHCKWTIQGNHDWGLFHELDDFNPLAREALFYTRTQLRPRFLRPRRRAAWEFLRTLPERMQDHGFLFCHGSPRDPVMEYVLKSDGFLEPDKMHQLFALIDRPCFVGHTHWPGVHRPDYRFTQATDDQNEFRLDGPAIVNVGSVGQPRDGDPRASFAVVDGDRVEIVRVPYDFRRTQAKILAAGLHPALAERLARGK
ncbi:MAG TPA: metallophosphoesterase family protein [Planctomycetota bacterium]|nr:metallophosphoesterase family protein [Planctomycetota bacterium]